jgi:hypothetical protein
MRSWARPGIWAFVIVGAVAFVQLLTTYVRGYAPGCGITKFIIIGHEFDARGLAVFRSTPKYIGPNDRWGFDGQFYAELALDPLLRDPQLKTALDDPPYRSRRILTSWLAWAGGLGRPFWILNAYAALNLVFWIGFAVLLARLFRPHGWPGLTGFAAMLLTCGIIESLHGSLTDFPGFTLLTLALMVGGTGGAVILALATLTREPNILGLVGLWEYRPPWLPAIRRNVWLGLLAGLPLALWVAYVVSRFPAEDSITGNNLAWPFLGIMGKLGEFSVHAANGDIHWTRWYSELFASDALHALLTIIAVLTQSIYLYTHREWENRIWRVGAVFVPYFICISSIPWESHFTITRHALPITLAFNLVLAMRARRGWLVWFLLGNCFVPYGVYRFANEGGAVTVPLAEYQMVSSQTPAPALQVRFGNGWSAEEWDRRHSWRWGLAQHATLVLVNPTAQPVEARLSFQTRSICSRDLVIRVRGAELWSMQAMRPVVPVETGRFLLPPGETVVDFESHTPTVASGHLRDDRQLSFMVTDLQVELSVPSDRK